ncbi:MAG: acetoin utilization protein AcuC [Rhodobacterales bacterium]|nr:acetoin utilization protein AcuC [Rhodobacterales bacterium]
MYTLETLKVLELKETNSAKAILIGSEIYRNSQFGGKHPLSIPRVSAVLDLVRAIGICNKEEYKTGPCAKPELLKSFHTADYIAVLKKTEVSQKISETDAKTYNIGSLSNPVFPEMFKRPATSVGSSLLAADLVADGGRAYSLGGGLHHGMAGYANGFCFLNDLVFAINRLRDLGVQRIAYIDLDAHHCDGVAAAFPEDENLFAVSTHERKRWPFTGGIDENIPDRLLNVPLPSQCNDTEFMFVFEKLVFPLLDRFQPEALIVQGGADALVEDPMSRLCLSNRVIFKILSILLESSQRVLLTGGGGYNPWTVARLWTGFWALISGRTVPEVLPYQATELLRSLSWQRQTKPKEIMLNSIYDVPMEGQLRDEVSDIVKKVSSLHKFKHS